MAKTGLWAMAALAVVAGGSGASAQTPVPPSPKDFVLATAQTDRYEIMAASVASAQAQDPRVRSLAQQLLGDHTRARDALRQAAVAAGLPAPPDGMSSDEASLLAGLQGLRGRDFDRAYARQQVLVHTQAVAVADSFAAAGADPTLRKAAQSELPTLRDHLKAAQQLRADLGGL